MLTITPDELRQRQARGEPLRLIDVRSPAEFRQAHVSGAINIPLDEFDPRAFATTDPICLICQKGGRSAKAWATCAAAGLSAVYSVEGGTDACESAGLPMQRTDSRRIISIERQARILAGTLVIIGATLALAIHPALAVVPIIIGCGLVFAGITDRCGMGLLLAKLPFNR